jgi:hypothetical protein
VKPRVLASRFESRSMGGFVMTKIETDDHPSPIVLPRVQTRGNALMRLTIDVVNECNLRCLYCHPGEYGASSNWIHCTCGRRS